MREKLRLWIEKIRRLLKTAGKTKVEDHTNGRTVMLRFRDNPDVEVPVKVTGCIFHPDYKHHIERNDK